MSQWSYDYAKGDGINCAKNISVPTLVIGNTADDGITPAYIAAEKGQAECLQLLIGAKADVDKSRTDNGCNPAFAAAKEGQAECLQLLIRAKADLDKATKRGSQHCYRCEETGTTLHLSLIHI